MAQVLLPIFVLLLFLALCHLAMVHGELAAERGARRMGDLRLQQLEQERAPGPYRVTTLSLDIVASRTGDGRWFARRGNGLGRGYGRTATEAVAELLDVETAGRRPS